MLFKFKCLVAKQHQQLSEYDWQGIVTAWMSTPTLGSFDLCFVSTFFLGRRDVMVLVVVPLTRLQEGEREGGREGEVREKRNESRRGGGKESEGRRREKENGRMRRRECEEHTMYTV